MPKAITDLTRDEVYTRTLHAASTLKTFIRRDLYRETEGGESVARIGLILLIADGTVERTGEMGRSREAKHPQGRRAPLYRFLKPRERFNYKPDPKMRPRETDPLITGRGRPKASQVPVAQPTTPKSSDDGVNALIEQALDQGAYVFRQGDGHIGVKFAGKRTTLSSSPSDHRSVLNMRAKLRRMGLDID